MTDLTVLSLEARFLFQPETFTEAIFANWFKKLLTDAYFFDFALTKAK